MLRSLYGKLAIALMLVFFALGAAFIVATEQMLEGRRLLELAADLVIGAIAFSLLAALIVFNLLTRRLRLLAAQMDAFRTHGLSQPMRGLTARPEGDEIDRLVIAYMRVRELEKDRDGQLSRRDRSPGHRIPGNVGPNCLATAGTRT